MLRAPLLAVLLSTAAFAQTDDILVRDASGQIVRLSAQADTDGDGIDNALEVNGFEFDLISGELVEWDGDPDARYFITDPLRVSTDGDPYSDLQEATGANMPSSVQAPYNHPLVAARPVIAVYLADYEVLPNGTLTDEAGQSQSQSYTNETRNESTAGVEIGAEVSLNPLELASASVTASYSQTRATVNSSTSTSGFDWSSARSVSEAEAAYLRLNVYYTNLGSAPASNVRPTLTVELGTKTIATFRASENSTALTLAPGGRYPQTGTIAIDRYVAGEVEVQIALTLDELKAVQLGTPLRLSVPQVEATIQRWSPATQSFDNEVTWGAFEDDINPVSMTVDAVVDGQPQQYQVYATVPGVTPRRRTVREAIDLIFDLDETASGTTIDGRSYPLDWYLSTDSQPLLDNWERAGRPQNLLGIEAVPGSRLIMLSSSGGEPRVDFTTYSRDLAQVYASALPVDGFPVRRAVATLFREESVTEVSLDASGLSAFLTNSEPVDFPYYGGFVTVTNARGDAVVRELALPAAPTRFGTCGDLATTVDGEYALYMTGRADRPIRVDCDFPDNGSGLPIEDPWTLSPDADGLVQAERILAAYAVDASTALLGVFRNGGSSDILRSTDGGRTWAAVAVPGILQSVADFAFVDDQTGFAVATSFPAGGEQGVMLRTTDAGATWTRMALPTGTGRLYAVDVLDADRAIALESTASGRDVLRTTDGGTTWRPLTVGGSGPASTRFDHVAYRQSGGDRLITVTSYDAIYTSLDDGVSWQTFTPSSISGVDPNRLDGLSFPTALVGYGTISDRVIKTTDGGRSWEVLFTDPADTVDGIHFISAADGFVVGGRDTALHTADGGATWYRQNARAGSGAALREIHVNGGLGLLTQDTGSNTAPSGRVEVTTAVDYTAGPRGETWTIRPKSLLVYAGDPRTIDGATSNAQAAEIFGQYGVVVFASGGYENDGFPLDLALREIVAHPAMAETEVYGLIDMGVTTSNQSEADWKLDHFFWIGTGGIEADGVLLANMGAAFGVDRERRCQAIAYANTGFAADRVIVAGATPQELFAQADQPCGTYSAEQARLGAGDAYLVEGYQVRDGAFVDGAQWRAEADALRALTEPYGARVMSLATGDNYDASAFQYAWLSAVVDEHAATGWTDADQGASNSQPIVFVAPDADPGRTYFTDLDVDLPTVARTTEGGRIEIDTRTHTATFGLTDGGGGGPTDAEGEPVAALELAQSFPNPTGSRATILYRLAEAGSVRLMVYDLLGREVAVLADGPRAAGEHEVRLDVSGLSSGVYVYMLRAGDHAESRRLTVVR